MPYCENCGVEVNLDAKFCRNCGSSQKVTQPTITQPVPLTQSPQQTSPTIGRGSELESVRGVMFLRKPKSLGRYDSFGGVVTNQRLIFAQITGEMLKDAVKMARDQAKAEGKGFFGQWADQLSASFGYIQKYLTMEPTAILSETSGNFDIDNSAIQEIKLKRKDISQGNTRIKQHEYEIEIKSSQGKYEFRMDDKNEYVALLNQTYGEKVKH